MVLSPDTRLGPYTILAPLGAGGMGEVYRAKDTRLDRDVAIKVLPEAFARDVERLARFQREAKVLASLNHPHIAAIYGFEEANGVRFLVLELVEGDTLADRLKAPGAPGLPVDEALGVCKQIAEAVEAAHEQGVIHRDLKPGNVKITPDGKVKVLDFGLAKALSGDATSTDIAHSPTITVDFTRPGVILGTAAYMSPEQARGRPVDKRSDIWSFGCVLYECLSGDRPFQGDTATDLIAKILERDPDWSTLPPQTPATIQLLLRRCLVKDRNRRLRDIGDARIEIENAIVDPTSSSLRLAAAAADEAGRGRLRPPRRVALPWLVAVVLAIALAVSLMMPRDRARPHERPVARVTIPVLSVAPRFGSLAIAPDGRYVVYRADPIDGVMRLHLRPMDEFGDRTLGGTEGGYAPFIAPDGDGVGFFTDRDLRVVSASGGSSQRVCEAFGFTAGAWGRDGTIIFSTGRSGDNALPGLSRVPATGGVPEILTTIDPAKNERAHVSPEFLPDGRHVLFTVETDTTRRVEVLSLETRQHQVLLEDASQPFYAPTGHLVFYHYNSLKVFAVPFDPATLRVTDRRIQVLGDLTRQAVVSQNGTLAYLPSGDETGNAAVWVDRQGNVTKLFDQPGSWVEPRLSPDGRKLILRQTQSPNCFLWLYDLDRSTLTRLTFEGDAHGPVWSGDGGHVLFGLERDAMRSLYSIPIDGSAAPARIWKGEGPEYPGRGSADGSRVPFVEESVQSGVDIWVLSMQGERKAEPFLQTPFREESPSFSPDGKWMAYASNESGRDEVYVRPYPGPGGKNQVSTDGGSGPLWSQDGKELFYARRDAMMAVEVTTEPAFNASAPRKLFAGEYAWGRQLNYDVAPDGQRFVLIKPQGGSGASQELHVVLNWFEELKAKVPAGTGR
jgi:Tol biopolymer transport system component